MARKTPETTITISVAASQKLKRAAKRHKLSVFRFMDLLCDHLPKVDLKDMIASHAKAAKSRRNKNG